MKTGGTWLGGACLALSLIAPAALAQGLEVFTLEGKPSTLAAQITPGHYTVVMIWSTYCEFCKRDFPQVSAFHEKHAGHAAEVLGIAVDGPAEMVKVREFVARRPFSFPSVVADPEALAAAFTAATGETFTGTPSYLVFNPARALAGALSGDLGPGTLERFLARQQAPSP